MDSPYDLVGAALPQALRLARYQASPTLPQNVGDIPSEDDVINKAPSLEEERLLASNANVMIALENLFSRKEKDRTSSTSQLSRVESFRFQRAMYRIWITSVLFGPRRFASKCGSSGEEDYDNHESNLRESLKDQKTFLEQFSSQELLHMRELSRFLTFIANWAITAEGKTLEGMRETYDWDGMFFFAGPHIILRCYEDTTDAHLPMERLYDYSSAKFLTHALSEVMRERQALMPVGYVGVILDKLKGEHDRCHHCKGNTNISGVSSSLRMLPELYNETNLDFLKGRVDRNFITVGNLFLNLAERPISQALSGDWAELIHEMFECKPDEYSEWKKEHWVCVGCWISFFRDTLWRWRLVRKKRDGLHIGNDCRYGYDCEEQQGESGLAHARQFNHLCKPIEAPPEKMNQSWGL